MDNNRSDTNLKVPDLFNIFIKNYIRDNIDKIVLTAAFILYIIITFKTIFIAGRIPNNDEAHAWCIAKNFDILHLIKLMHYEGHFLLWYLVIKPFAVHNLFYPYIMQFINWIFILGTILLILLKSPFSTPLKLTITLSIPFLQIYPIYARCYAIGFFFLFLSMCIYKERFNHPYIYLTTLVLCANTNLLMCVISCLMAILFLYDLIKYKLSTKTILVVVSTALLNIILWGFQFIPLYIPEYATHFIPAQMLTFLRINPEANLITQINISILQIFILIYLIQISKSKKTFIVTTFACIFYIFLFTKIYLCMHMMHVWLPYIILIFSFWLLKNEGYTNKFLEYCLIALSAVFIFYPRSMEWPGVPYEFITTKKNIIVFIDENFISSTLPYLWKNNVEAKNMEGESFYNQHFYYQYQYNIDKVAEHARPGNFIFLKTKVDKLEGKNNIIYLVTDSQTPLGYLLKITKIESLTNK